MFECRMHHGKTSVFGFDGPENGYRVNKYQLIEKRCDEPTFTKFHFITGPWINDSTWRVMFFSWSYTSLLWKGKNPWDVMGQNHQCFRILSSKHLSLLVNSILKLSLLTSDSFLKLMGKDIQMYTQNLASSMMFWSLPSLWRPLVVFENDVISGKCRRRVVLWNCSIGQSRFSPTIFFRGGVGYVWKLGPRKSL